MFENMTKRERVLATVVACLVPIVAIFMGFMWFIGTYNDQGMEIIRLQKDLKNKKDLYNEAQLATQRRVYYEATSFPPDESEAKLASDEWLQDLIEENAGMKIQTTKRLGSNRIRTTRDGRTTVIGIKISRSVTMVGTLDQWVHFVYEFNRAALMKRLVSFKLTPRTIGGTGKQKLVRSGKFSIEATFEFVSLTNAVEGQPLNEGQVPATRSLAEYRQVISQRNIFAPANNPPVLTVASTKSTTAGDEISFPVDATDADEQDLLKLTLLSTHLEGAVLTQPSPDSRRAIFKSPPLEVGEYTLVFQAADNGNPSKTVQKEVVLKVTKKRNNQPALTRDSRSIEVYAGEPVNFKLVAEDRDEDPVTFELQDTDLPGAVLSPIEGTNEAEFVCEALESGDYRFDVKLDDGKEPRMRNGEPVPAIANVRLTVLAPKFLVASQTKVGAFVRNKKGETVVWIQVRPQGIQHNVQEGDSFDLDRSTWVVKSILFDKREIVFEVDGMLRTYQFRDFLSNPRKEEPVATEISTLPALSKSDIEPTSSDN